MWAMAGQESGWDYFARNRVSGAYGKYQIMPMNWPSWAETYLGSRQADQTPWNQERVAYGRLRDLYRTLGSWDRVAYWWLTGSNEPRRKRWSAYAAGYVDSIMRLRRRAPHDGGPMPRRTSSRVDRGDWRVVDGRQVLRLGAAGRPWRRDGRHRERRRREGADGATGAYGHDLAPRGHVRRPARMAAPGQDDAGAIARGSASLA